MQTTQTTVSQISNYKYYCGGVTTPPPWTILYSNTLILNVDTSSCQFNSTPLYFTSFSGAGNHYGLASYTAIYKPTKTSFTICVTSLFGWSAALMLNYSSSAQWNINWL